MNTERLKELRRKVTDLRDEINESFLGFDACHLDDHLYWDVRNNIIDSLFRASSGLHALWATEVEREKQESKNENS